MGICGIYCLVFIFYEFIYLYLWPKYHFYVSMHSFRPCFFFFSLSVLLSSKSTSTLRDKMESDLPDKNKMCCHSRCSVRTRVHIRSLEEIQKEIKLSELENKFVCLKSSGRAVPVSAHALRGIKDLNEIINEHPSMSKTQ